MQTLTAIDELDFGKWTGRSFVELDADPRWRAWNTRRGSARIPGGESTLEVQRRAVDGLERLAAGHTGKTIAAVSHADVLRAVLAFWMGMPLDDLLQLEVEPASVHAVRFDGTNRVVTPLSSPRRQETPERP